MLKSMRKALTVEEMGSTLEIVHKNDIPVYGAFIFVIQQKRTLPHEYNAVVEGAP